jgi:Na+/H+-translocating membrane pyrophosphatase
MTPVTQLSLRILLGTMSVIAPGRDLFESTAAENIGAMILGVDLYPVFGLNGIMFPMVARALGLIAPIGIMTVRGQEGEDPMTTLNRGFYITVVNLAKVHVFVGGLLGAMLVFLFSALAIRAVSRAAYYVIHEVRRQFEENSGIMRGELKSNYARCVDIVTAGALQEMVMPGLLAVSMPIAVGLVLRAEAVAALLMVGTITGILLAIAMNNGGGAWDNAKKYIESGINGGKGSETHKAAVVGDTVGDPFKDTAGSSLHVLIIFLSSITLVMAPLFV